MAEKIVSPGVFTKEIDASFLPAAIGEIGACVVGPTVKGPALTPIVVNTYSEFQQIFGDSFKSGSGYHQYLTSHTAKNYLQHAGSLLVCRVMAPNFGAASASVTQSGATGNSFDIVTTAHGSTLSNGFIHSFSGSISASVGDSWVNVESASGNLGSNATLISGSKDNLRWEVTGVNQTKGTFNLLIRAGNDTVKRKQILESWNNLSLDPNQNNYIRKVIGDQYFTIDNSDAANPFLKPNGEYPNQSKYVRISNVKDTIDYFDENGDVRDSNATNQLPAVGSGSYAGAFFGGGDGDILAHKALNENISDTNTQGFNLSTLAVKNQYISALNLLSNSDEYDFNLLLIPGILRNLSNHTAVITKAIDVCETRADAFAVVDICDYSVNSVSTAAAEGAKMDSNYAATYWPWVQVPDDQSGKNVWVPPSVAVANVISFNDKVGNPWLAPAGLNRGVMTTAVQAKRKLTNNNRDTLYESSVNPIATFPAEGVVIWGQKTLQKKSSALDRINVRRLLIRVKKFLAASSRFLLFEQNNAKTRNRFLAIANPFLTEIQEKAGLSAFKVVMDTSNNTPDIVDRNILYGQVFLQPTRTAEFIILDFTIQPTGAAFPE